MEGYCIAAFRSRQQVMAFERALAHLGVRGDIVTTPRAVSVGCGLSVRFDKKDLESVKRLTRNVQPGSLVGVYEVKDGRVRVL